ncbi:cytochrome P450 [Tricladium varicosporioides]|nr:cytochrome P450 [Hymenoscyphus varicosporioides]
MLTIYDKIALLVANFIFNLYFHPLRLFPGPWYCGISRLWALIQVTRGIFPYKVAELHEKYGEVVRIAPNELMFTSPDAWQTIYGKNPLPGGGSSLLRKDPAFYGTIFEQKETLMDAEGEKLKASKKPLSHAFSLTSILVTQSHLDSYTSALINQLQKHVNSGAPADLFSYFSNWITDLSVWATVHADFGAMKYGEKSEGLLTSIHFNVFILLILAQLRRMSSATKQLERLLSPFIYKLRMFGRIGFIRALLKQRIERGDDDNDPDYVSYLLPSKEEVLDFEDVFTNTATLVLASVSATSVVLTGAIFNIHSSPYALSLLKSEIHSSFKTSEDITLLTTSNLPYLNACINENFRMYSPVPGGLPRVTRNAGDVICGRFVPGNTIVNISHFAAFRSPKNYTEPNAFKPERWLAGSGSDKYDKLEAVFPFSLGPRTCIAKEKSIMYLRFILARLIWEFDIDLEDSSKGWDYQKSAVLFRPGPLNVRIKRREQ